MKVKTILKIEDTVMDSLKKEADSRGCTISALVESAVQLMFQSKKGSQKISPLPTFKSGGSMVDIADRDALFNL
jgi:hypothetical protein